MFLFYFHCYFVHGILNTLFLISNDLDNLEEEAENIRDGEWGVCILRPKTTILPTITPVPTTRPRDGTFLFLIYFCI